MESENDRMEYVFIHGLGQKSSSWNKTISFMSNSAHISCPDLLTILNQEEVVYENLYLAFSQYCDNISGRLNLCGLSIGAILALNYTIDRPEKVRSLALIGAQYKMPKSLLKLQNIVFRLMPKNSFMTTGFQKKDFIQLTNSMLDLDFSKRLKDISCPALIICGGKDRANKKAAKTLFKSISNAEFHLIEEIGHEVNIEAPELLANIIGN